MTHPPTPRRRGRPRSTTSDDPFVRLQLDSEAKRAMDKLCERRGMTLTAAMSRLAGWLVNQDEIVQAWVLGLMSEQNLGPMSETFLRRTAGRDGK